MSDVKIKGWLSENEMLALRRWCFDKTVLEMGAYEGLSSCNIALTAKGLVVVDTFDGRGCGEEPRDTEEAFWTNIKAVERSAPVQVQKGTFAEVLPRLDRKFDIVFIDGSHDYDSVVQDIELAVDRLEEDGVLLMHDYCTKQPGVQRAIDELVAEGAIPVAQEDTLVMLRMKPLPNKEPTPVKVVVGMPHRDGWALYGSVMAATSWASDRYTRATVNYGSSILTLSFNNIFAQALNMRDQEGFTHFAMLHNDVVPCNNWVDILVDELVANQLDMISAVVPLKNGKGLTSTATDHPDGPWGVRRLTMTEVMQLPETFTARDIPFREDMSCLLLNSGCTLMKLNEPWTQGLHFRQQDRIVWCIKDGDWAPQSISEDWDFSRQLYHRGCRLGATRKVKLFHQNEVYHNHSAWGTQQRDEDWFTAEADTAHLRATRENGVRTNKALA